MGMGVAICLSIHALANFFGKRKPTAKKNDTSKSYGAGDVAKAGLKIMGKSSKVVNLALFTILAIEGGIMVKQSSVEGMIFASAVKGDKDGIIRDIFILILVYFCGVVVEILRAVILAKFLASCTLTMQQMVVAQVREMKPDNFE